MCLLVENCLVRGFGTIVLRITIVVSTSLLGQTHLATNKYGCQDEFVRSLISRISGLDCDTFQDPTRVLPATRANPQDSKNGDFYLPRSRDCRGALPSSKTIVLMALAVVHGQSRGGL